MGAVYAGAPRELMAALAREFHVQTFVETGTFRGETTAWAAGLFPEVFSVEAQAELFRDTSEKLHRLTNVVLRNSDTRTFLSELVPALAGPALFWLDAHWCGSEWTHGAADECPLLRELEIIARSPHAHYVLIDDARLFLAPPGPPHDSHAWPTLREVMSSPVIANPQSYTVVFDDVIATVPLAARDWLAAYLLGEVHRRNNDQLLESGVKLSLQGLRQVGSGLRRRVRKLLG